MKQSFIGGAARVADLLGLVIAFALVAHATSAEIWIAPIIEDAEVEDPQTDMRVTPSSRASCLTVWATTVST